MKKLLLILSLIFVIVAANVILFVMLVPVPLGKEPIHIAVTGPMNNPRGKAMQEATELYKDLVSSQGGIDGRRLEFTYFDDKDDPRTAEKIASEIADKNKALLVIGHYRNVPSYAAGKIYKKNEIPAITASAAAEYVTSENEWYFRVIPNNVMEAVFAANYIATGMESTTASIIFTRDNHGTAFAENFEKTCISLGVKLKKKLEWDTAKNPDPQLKKIVSELKAEDDPGILFLATHSAEGVKIVTALRDEGKTLTVLGSYAFAKNFFIEMKKYPREWSDPGYYSDGIYFISKYMFNVGGVENYRFTRNFYKKYNKIPSSTSACYYDAVHVAVQAIKKTGIQGKELIREDRRKIRDALEGFYSEENAVRGISGHVWFNENGDTTRHFLVGTWQDHREFPAFVQYQHSIGKKYADLTKKILNNEIILTGGILMKKNRIIHAGAENIRIHNLDTEHHACTLEFDLMFRYSGHFDDTSIEFINSVTPISLGQPFSQETEDNITTRKYHVKGDFRCDFDFRAYPFDNHVIMIRFRHTRLTSDELIYIADVPFIIPDISLPDWNIPSISFFQDLLKKDSTLGNPKFFESPHMISYSQFNIKIRVQRRAPTLVFIYFLVIMSMLVMLLYVVCFARPDQLRHRVLIFMGVLVTCAVCHMISLSLLSAEYLTVADCFFISVYALSAICAFISAFSYKRYIKRKENIKPGLWIKP